MNKLVKLISRLPNYIFRFGILKGVCLLFRIERTLPKDSHKTYTYNVPGYSEPIYLRNSIGDHSIFWQCIVRNQYEFTHHPQSERLISSYKKMQGNCDKVLIIDCGANIGLATLWYAKMFPSAYIYTVEPDAENNNLLQKNTAHLRGRITCLHGAIWNDNSSVDIINPEAGSSAFQVSTSNTKGSIQTYTIGQICKLAGVKYPFIVKIDIEGAQGKLFSSNTEWVNGTHFISIEPEDWLLPWQGTSRSFFSCISHYPFDYLLEGENLFCYQDFEAK